MSCGDSHLGKICVIGLGYIGLPTAAMFASRRHHVVGVDVNPLTVDIINKGNVHIVEPDLDIVVRASVRGGYLRATTTPSEADAFIIAVPTPFKNEDHEPDLKFIEAAAYSIAPVLKAGNLVVLESTSPIGATETLCSWLASARPDLSFPHELGDESDIRVAHCPERVLPGRVMQELVTNDRVIGGITKKCAERAVELYRSFVTGACIIASGPREAEMAKLVENSFRDVNIAFANELSIVCDKLEIDVWELISLANRHPRVNILKPGPGVGGHCIAVDPWFLISSAPEEAKLITAAREVNDRKPHWVVEKIKSKALALAKPSESPDRSPVTIACYGIAFKPDIDDLRESPAVAVVRALNEGLSGDCRILVVEPHIMDLPEHLADCELVTGDEALRAADLNLILVRHTAFESLEFPSSETMDFVGILNEI